MYVYLSACVSVYCRLAASSVYLCVRLIGAVRPLLVTVQTHPAVVVQPSYAYGGTI